MVGRREVATISLGGRKLERMTASVDNLKSGIESIACKHEIVILERRTFK
jgi:hypothetical protein